MSSSHGIQAGLQYQMVDQLQRSTWQADLQISPGPMDPIPGSSEICMWRSGDILTHCCGFHLLFKRTANVLIS